MLNHLLPTPYRCFSIPRHFYLTTNSVIMDLLPTNLFPNFCRIREKPSTRTAISRHFLLPCHLKVKSLSLADPLHIQLGSSRVPIPRFPNLSDGWDFWSYEHLVKHGSITLFCRGSEIFEFE